MNNFFTGNTSGNNFSRDFSKGKSFQFSGTWNRTTVYNNDGFIQDFVVHNQKLWACIKNVSVNSEPSETNNDWILILDGVSDVEFRKNPENQNEIQWKYEDDEIWRDLIEFDIVSEDQIKKMLEDLDIKYGNTYDTELSETSTNAVQNQAITKKFKELDDKNTKTDSELVNIKSSVNTALSNSKSYTDSKISETKIQIDSGLNKKVNQSDVEEIVDELNKSINLKVDKVYGKGLSTNDFNDNYKSKLDNLDSSLNSVLTSAKSHTNSEITKVDNKINSETSRAKTSETNLSSRIDNLGEDVIKSLNEAKEYTDALANGEVKNNTNKINILNGTGEGSVKKTVKDEISNLVGTAPEKLDTLQEIADYLEEHEDMASGLVNSLSELETKKADKTELNNLKTDTDSALQSLEKTKANTTGNYPLLHVGTADDLAGRGESVPASFGFRASGGKSIKDGRAYIKRIKGNSVVWNQHVDFNNPIAFGTSSVTLENGEYILTLSGGLANAVQFPSAPFVQGRSILFLCEYTSEESAGNINMKFGAAEAAGAQGLTFQATKANSIFTINSAIQKGKGAFWIWTSNASIIRIKSLRVIDLTKAFPNDEPTTIEEFNARVATLGVDMNAYNEGQVIHCNTESIKSVGDNAWDEQWELGKLNSRGEPYADNTLIRPKNFTRVIPNETYYFHGTFGYGIYFYDADKNYVKTLYVNNNKLQIPSNAMYLKFNFPTDYGTTYKNDMCIRLAHTGYKTDYEPYWQDILPLPIIRKYFPDGMKKAGSAHDEIRYNKASGKWEYTKSKTGGGRIKGVDMGSMAWSLDSANQVFTSYTIMDLMTHPAEVSERNKGLLCSKYSPSRTYVASTMDDKSWLCIPKSVTIKDTSYTDAASFKAAMAGVILYYESNDWEWVELDAEDQNFRDYYNVADFGTEMSQSSVPSAPFSADIIYQFNAVDMIREHELEITDIKVSKQDFISDLSTIRSNAAKGATALQNVPSEYVKRSELTALQNEINVLRAMIEEITTQE